MGQRTIRDGGVRWLTVWGGGVGQLNQGWRSEVAYSLRWRDRSAYHQGWRSEVAYSLRVEGWVSLLSGMEE